MYYKARLVSFALNILPLYCTFLLEKLGKNHTVWPGHQPNNYTSIATLFKKSSQQIINFSNMSS